MASSKSPSALEPRFATLRCWEHEDCVDHPELGLVCCDGEPDQPLGMDGEHITCELEREMFWWDSDDGDGLGRQVETGFGGGSGSGLGCGDYGTTRGDGSLAANVGLDPISEDFPDMCVAVQTNPWWTDLARFRDNLAAVGQRLEDVQSRLADIGAELAQMRRGR